MRSVNIPILFLYGLVLMIASCEKGADAVSLDSEEERLIVSSDDFVTKSQLVSLINKKANNTRGVSLDDYSIEARLSAEGDTLMYVVNYNGQGWTIFSADSRTPAILAEGDSGSFSVEEGSPALSLWMEMLSTNMANVRRSCDENLKFTSEEISANKTFWSDSEQEPIRNPRPPQYEGYWITHTSIETFVYDTLEHMTPRWYQIAPYNQYCPLKSWSLTVHQPAGCVAVAGAQILYYLHGKIGVPVNAYGSCSIVDGTPYFSDLSESNWEQMSPDYPNPGTAEKEAILIAKVGDLVGMHYSDTSSWSYSSRLKRIAFPDQGISCSRSDYCQDTIKRYLNLQYPVIVSASDLLIPIGRFHTFVIDGYKKTYKRYTYCHEFIPADPETMILPGSGYESYYTYDTSAPDITAIKINWGWNTQWREENPLNDGWYTLTADWVVENNGSYNYNHNVSMIYGFEIIE